jgi:Tfp pilus assembly protein PilF
MAALILLLTCAPGAETSVRDVAEPTISRAHEPTAATASIASSQEPSALQDTLKRLSAVVFFRPHGIEAAIKDLKAVLAAHPQSAEAHFLLGVAYGRLRATEFMSEAKAEFQQALALDPKLVHARYDLAQVYLDLGRAAKARDELQTALVHGPRQFLALLGETEREFLASRRA